MKYPETVKIFEKEFKKNENSSLWIKPNGDDLCYYPHIPEEVKSAVRNNFGIGVDEEILFVRDTSFWNSRNQGLVITDYAIKCIPDNDNVKDFILIPWNSIDHVEYESLYLYFFGEERDDNVPINIDFFTKDMPNAVKRVCGTSLAKALTNVAKTQENLEDVIDDDVSEREKLEKEGNFIKHPETVKAFTSSLQELGIDLYGHVYPNIPNDVESLARDMFFLEKDEVVLYVNLNEEKDEGIVITDCRFHRLRDYENKPSFRNWSEITIEFDSDGCLRFIQLGGKQKALSITAGDFKPLKKVEIKLEQPSSTPTPTATSTSKSFLGDIADEVKDLADEYLRSKWWGRILLSDKIEQEEMEIEEAKLKKRQGIKRRIAENKIYLRFLSKIIESQNHVKINDVDKLQIEAARGDAEAQYNLGNCYKDGKGVEQNCDIAAKWYRKAIEQGYSKALINLGKCHESNWHYDEAAKCFMKAAGQGFAEAQYCLGTLYYIGKGVKRDRREAVKRYRESAEQGFADAQYSLGRCYAEGKGVNQNNSEAIKWYKMAAEQGHYGAKDKLKKLL